MCVCGDETVSESWVIMSSLLTCSSMMAGGRVVLVMVDPGGVGCVVEGGKEWEGGGLDIRW